APNQAPAKLLAQVGAPLEGAVVDNAGHLFVTGLTTGGVYEIDTPGAAPHRVATIPANGGGGALALDPQGNVLVGSGADTRVLAGDYLHPGVISRLNLAAGTLTPLYSGFSAADGLAVAHDGTIYATNDFAAEVGRVTPDGKVQPAWTKFNSANGAVLSADDKYLYVSRTFVNPGVSRIPIADPTHPQSLLTMTGTNFFAAPDGLTLDSQGRPVVPTDVLGQILRIDAPGHACSLVANLRSSSVIVYGKGTTGFAKGHLYRAGFDGNVYEIPSAFDAGA
ncbi:MAG: hypothetical protein AAGC46_08015, partial [Solirubrobacteraceae bacterium]|nr:hypothetical protein [Patulibacter sp.]